MNYFTAKKFSFISQALPADTFGVITMKGSEGISRPYEFEVMLVADNPDIDFEAIMQSTARLVFHRETGDDAIYNGIVTHFDHLHAVGDYAFYRACLVPRLWWLSITRHNQIILDKSVPEFARMVLIDGGLMANDFEFRLQGDYEPIEYVCQYNESHLNFLSRWLEREGIYYYFDQTPDGEKVIFTDTHVAHTDLAAGGTLSYLPPSGLEALHTAEVIKSFQCCREIYHGEGSVPFMLPGFTFTLDNHYRQGVNQGYLITDIEHEGNQTGYLLAGITVEPGAGNKENKIYYRNSFTAIPRSVQFRSEVKAEKPHISGTISGRVDAAGSGQYAELDPQGRYKIIFPFDLSGRTGGKASKWVRMAQPYAGSDHGMHFPLHKGAEVLITFLNGDPDRPIIAGAVPNPGTPSPVTGNNQSMSVLNTAGRNRIAIEDKAGSERMLFHSPNQGSYIRIGAPNDPDPYGDSNPASTARPGTDSGGASAGTTVSQTGYATQDQVTNLQNQIDELKGDDSDDGDDKDIAGIKLSTPSGAFTFEAGAKNEVCIGESVEVTIGAAVEAFLIAMADICLGERFICDVGAKQEISLGPVVELRRGKTKILNNERKLIDEEAEFSERVSKVIGSKMEAAGNKTEVTEQKTAAHVDHLEATETNTRASAQKSEVAGVVEKAVAEKTQALGSRVDAMAERVDTCAQVTQAFGDEITTAASSVRTLASILLNAAEHNAIHLNSNELTTLKSIL